MSRAKKLTDSLSEKEPAGVKKRIDQAKELLQQAMDNAMDAKVQSRIKDAIKAVGSIRA